MYATAFAIKPSKNQKTPDDSSFVRVSKIDPRYFELSNGTPYIPLGPNICFPRLIIDEKLGFESIEIMYKNLAKYGANYTRVYLASDFFEIENQKQGVFNESQMKRVDKVLSLAKQYHLRVKLCFEQFRFLKDTTKRFPGSASFQKPIYHVDNGGSFKTPDEYFNSEKGKEVYMNRVRFIVNRYKNNPIILGWELWNEFDAVEIAGKNQSLIDWTKDILTRVHALDSNHLVMQNLGSLDRDAAIPLYKSVDTIQNNDVATVHRYIDLGAKFKVCHGPMDILASDAVKELQKFNLHKPILLAETGAVEPHHAAPSKLYLKDTTGIILHDILFAPFFAGSAGSGQSWHWKEYLERNNLWYHFGRFNEAIKGVNPLVENFQPSEFTIPECRAYVLSGQKTTLVWCRDAGSNWQTELIENKKPYEVHTSIPLSKLGIKAKNIKSVHVYDPWKNTWSKIKVVDNKIKLLGFTRSIVVKIQK